MSITSDWIAARQRRNRGEVDEVDERIAARLEATRQYADARLDQIKAGLLRVDTRRRCRPPPPVTPRR